MENEGTKSRKKVTIAIVVAIIIIGVISLLIYRKYKVSFELNDKAYFNMFTNSFEQGECEFKSLDAYYLRDTRTYYYNAKYTFYEEIEGKWCDVDEVAYGSIGHFENMYCLSWDTLHGFDEVDKEFKRAVKEGVHKTYTEEEIQEMLEEAYQEKEKEDE